MQTQSGLPIHTGTGKPDVYFNPAIYAHALGDMVREVGRLSFDSHELPREPFVESQVCRRVDRAARDLGSLPSEYELFRYTAPTGQAPAAEPQKAIDGLGAYGIAVVAYRSLHAMDEWLGAEKRERWELLTPEERARFTDGVRWRIDHPDAPVSAQHEAWLDAHARDGWLYGPTLDRVNKRHPYMRPFTELTAIEQVRDHLFVAVVRALAPFSPAT